MAGLYGAIIAEEVYGLTPCVLCVLQRIPYGAVALLGLIAFALRTSAYAAHVITLSGVVLLIGAGVAAYHVAVEQQWVQMSALCQTGSAALPTSLEAMMTQSAAPPALSACNQPTWLIKGVSVSVYNFIGSCVLGVMMLIFGLKVSAPRKRAGQPAKKA